MQPTAITLRNFRGYAGPQHLELRPLTLLFGTNNSGKSALVRSLPLLADSLRSDGLDALDFSHRLASDALDFRSLRYKGRADTDDRWIGVTIHWDDDVLAEAEFHLWEADGWQRIVVERLVLRNSGGDNLLETQWQLTRGDAQNQRLHNLIKNRNTEEQEAHLLFRGLRPDFDSTPFADMPILKKLDERVKSLAASVLWLRSLRPAPKRFTSWVGAARWQLMPNGSDAPVILATESRLLEKVSAWYEQHVGHQLVLMHSKPREVRVALRSTTAAAYDVDLIDCGEGLSQVLSVLTAAEMARTRSQPAIIAVEEPEAHLHPNLQVALMDHLCDVIASSNTQMLLETHSAHLLLAAQLAVVEGRLRPEDVAVYWVAQRADGSSVADLVTMDKNGRFEGNWPPDALQQDMALAARLLDAREKEAKAAQP